MIQFFRISDNEKVAMLANCPYNKLIKDRVIIPPASDVKTIRKIIKDGDCYGWWFCYRKQ